MDRRKRLDMANTLEAKLKQELAKGQLMMINWHKRHVEFWKSKLGVSDYGMLWIAFIEGILFGLLVYHYIIAN